MSSSSQDAPPASPAPCRILCVDDERGIREMLTLLLAREGHAVETAEDGREAWSRLQSDLQRFDVVITDIQMPHLSGLALVEHLRSVNFRGGIIVFSSSLNGETRRRLEAWNVAVVEKGAHMSILRAALRRVVAQREWVATGSAASDE